MFGQPTLETARLVLRPFCAADAGRVQLLAGDRAVADTTLKIPHPYEDGMAEKWIANHADWFQRDEQAVFAVTLKTDAALIGCVGLRIDRDDDRAELGYWIGRPYWGQGYCTEAVRAVLAFGFAELGLNRIHAHHFVRNAASGRVMQKAGMQREGRLRQFAKKWDVFEDVEMYATVREQASAAGRKDAPNRD
jgi:[ribosomal protein S5]-alanine N-acetyltransferase